MSVRLPRTVRTAAVTLAAAAVLPALVLASTLPAAAGITDQNAERATSVCKDLDSGLRTVRSRVESLVVSAPKGRLVAAYCVGSAGLKGETGAPYYVKLEKPLAELVLTHPDGGRLIDYSMVYVSADDPEPVEADPVTPPSGRPFDWDWKYDAPTCSALTVDYPKDLPGDQANDVNIRVKTDKGEVTLNYHNNDSFWTGSTGFTYSQHQNWPRGVTEYAVTWVQVGGTNYHWQGDVSCQTTSDGDRSTVDLPKEVTEVEGYRTGKMDVARGKAVAADVVKVEGEGLEPAVLQLHTDEGWSTVATVRTDRDGMAKVSYPKLAKKGVYKFRLAVAGTESVTGTKTALLTARVH